MSEEEASFTVNRWSAFTDDELGALNDWSDYVCMTTAGTLPDFEQALISEIVDELKRRREDPAEPSGPSTPA